MGATGTALYLLLTNLTLWVMLVVAIPLVRAQILDGVTLTVLALVTLASFEGVTPLGPAAQFLQSSLRAARRFLRWWYACKRERAAASRTGPGPGGAGDPAPDFCLRAQPRASLAGFQPATGTGKTVALVGPNGAGKSTLVHLLLRFWDYESGEIRLDGRELSEYAAEEVRRQIAVISPAAYFFSETLRQNLLLARPEATDEELRRALAQVELQDWLASLPAGLDSWVGQFGLQMRAENANGWRRRVRCCNRRLSWRWTNQLPTWTCRPPGAWRRR